MIFPLSCLLLSLIVSMPSVQAETLVQEDKVEIVNRWGAYLKSQDEKGEFDNYIAAILDITEADAQVAKKIAESSFDQDPWKEFVEKKDLSATLALIEFMTFVLQRVVWNDCALKFPPHLADIAADMEKSGLTQEEYLTNVRRAFLAFTIIVSCMDQVIDLEQFA